MTCMEARPWHRETMESSLEQWRVSGPPSQERKSK
jgi:hypothetical protein